MKYYLEASEYKPASDTVTKLRDLSAMSARHFQL